MMVSDVFNGIKDALLTNNLVQKRSCHPKPQVDPEQAGSIELQNFDQ